MATRPADQPYFAAFLDRTPEKVTRFEGPARQLWHLLAGVTIGLGIWYLHWRWSASLNTEALVFSVAVALAETMAFLGMMIFYFNIWDEGDTPTQPPPENRGDAGLDGGGDILVDVFITTYDEGTEIVAPSIDAAKDLIAPLGTRVAVHLLDDGGRAEMQDLCRAKRISYLRRDQNRGYKAGNLANALFQTEGDFVVICDADTQLFPQFLTETLGYFRDSGIAWVQTPHWFYDIPEGTSWRDVLDRMSIPCAGFLAPVMRFLSGRKTVGADPFLSEPAMFFDVIQRRRNRHNASFCCGAGSVHRREAIFHNAMLEQGRKLKHSEQLVAENTGRALLPRLDMQPFRYHVSEDIFTSLQQQSNGWKSVYHPEPLARMLSPWTAEAWAMQKLKYAGGTYDIMFRTGLIFRRGLPWQTKLHYLSTYWSYLGVFWVPILFLAPMFSLVTGLAPVDAYSITFFLHLLPLLAFNELAMTVAAKGHDIHAGRILSLATLTIQWRALIQVLQGHKPHFPPTPKTPVVSASLRYAVPNLLLLAAMILSATYGFWAFKHGSETHSLSLLLVNYFWLGINALALVRVIRSAFWRPRLPDGTLLQPAE
ncbi:cellulose synthase catalytic subunit [Phaeobacter sp. J2-8]|uniref:glycosyltransferase family 2 protein n=1 Tax=Phaeobacter sp. J2-8 TaxID=2931394 RepID=UPI001FCFFE60|nr:cellulose synthase catalytic subunit [Phaeobacter sp. J2-8]MCJ7873993.1 glycosyltransferase [Phaeobacter sp. J2-8]